MREGGSAAGSAAATGFAAATGSWRGKGGVTVPCRVGGVFNPTGSLFAAFVFTTTGSRFATFAAFAVEPFVATESSFMEVVAVVVAVAVAVAGTALAGGMEVSAIGKTLLCRRIGK